MSTKVIQSVPPKPMLKRINVILKDETAQTVRRAAKAGKRSATAICETRSPATGLPWIRPHRRPPI